MQTVRIDAFGGVDVLRIMEQPIPEAREGDVLVRVVAAGLNYSDLMQREGRYPGGPKPPFCPGVEAAGIIEQVGSKTSPFLAIGSRVACITKNGAHAEFVLSPSGHCVIVPEFISFLEGAGLLVHYLTAYHALITTCRACEGETVVIHAAGGGVGTAAVQIAKVLGLRVVGTTSTSEKRERIRDLGADIAVEYDEFEAATREITEGHGPDIIFDTVGGRIFLRSLKLLRPLGRIVIAGFSSLEAQPIDSLRLLLRSQNVIGFHLNSILARRDLVEESIARLFEWIAQGRLKIQIGRTFPLADIREAHEFMASRNSYGKVVLIPGTGK